MNNRKLIFNVCLIHLFLVLIQTEKTLYPTKVIGVLTIPNKYLGKYMGYVDEVYYNFLRQSGLQILAIPYWKPKQFLKKMFLKTNGLFFQGGLSTYFWYHFQGNPSYKMFSNNIKYLLSLAVEANENNDYYPVFGTCMGFHHISMYFAKSISVLSKVDHMNKVGKLIPTKHFQNSKIFSRSSDELKNHLTTNFALYYSHHWAVTNNTYYNNQELMDNFDVLGWNEYYNKDHDQHYTFIAVMQHKKYPIYAMQYHVEKAQFLLDFRKIIPRTPQTFQLAFNTVLFIRDELQKNHHDTYDIKQYEQYNLYYLVPELIRKHYDPKLFTFYYNDTKSKYAQQCHHQ